MISDLRTVMWKEFREFLAQRGSSTRSAALMAAFPVVFLGVFMPWRMGPRWVSESSSLLMLGWMPLFLVIAMVADSFAGERERHTLETLLATRLSDQAILYGKIAAAVSYAWGLVLVSVVLGLITVNLAHGHGQLLMLPGDRLLSLVVFGLLMALLSSSIGVLVSLRSSTVRQAAQTLSLGFMVVTFSVVFGLRALPGSWQAWMLGAINGQEGSMPAVWAAVVLAVVDILLLELARLRFQRDRLILD